MNHKQRKHKENHTKAYPNQMTETWNYNYSDKEKIQNQLEENRTHSTKRHKSNIVMVLKAREQRSNTFTVLKEETVGLECYAYKDVFQNWRRNRAFSDKQKPKELTVNRSVLQENLKQII